MNRYQSELDSFREHFAGFADKRIALYGIGRMTITLLEGIKDFQFVALLDRDPSSTGKEILGIPVVSLDEAEEKADLIIINTSKTYWDIIFSRIENSQIPVYFKNGERAKKKEQENENNPYKELSLSGLIEESKNADVISFDFFDTLFMRRVIQPTDVIHLLEDEFRTEWKHQVSYAECRNLAKIKLSVTYTLDELYQELESETGLPSALLKRIKLRELEQEKNLLIPRKEILEYMRNCIQEGKDVYILSDMYLPESFYTDVLIAHGITLPYSHILLSGKLKLSKKDGSLWQYYAEKIVRKRNAVHIGDDSTSDIENPKACGIRSCLVPSAYDLLKASSFGSILPKVRSFYASCILGLVGARLFANPYALFRRDSKVEVCSERDMGYVVFGPVILTFLLWLLEKIKVDSIKKILFLARDGYFLKEDFEFLCVSLGMTVPCSYIGISRQLAMASSIESDDDLLAYFGMPYSGGIGELFEDRCGLHIECGDNASLAKCIEKNKKQIYTRIHEIQNNYRKYINAQKVMSLSAVVDLGYYGNNQKYLEKILKKNFTDTTLRRTSPRRIKTRKPKKCILVFSQTMTRMHQPAKCMGKHSIWRAS